MKNICLSLGLVLTGLLFTTSAFGQSKGKFQDSTFTVRGVCDMCEERIEDAALIKGVRSAEWDRHTQTIRVIYKTKQVNADEIKTAIAKAGHDTDEILAEDEAYAKLPDCCAYRDGVKVH